MAEWTIKQQTIYVRGDLKLVFKRNGAPSTDRVGHTFVLDVVDRNRSYRVRFTPDGEVMSCNRLTVPTVGSI